MREHRDKAGGEHREASASTHAARIERNGTGRLSTKHRGTPALARARAHTPACGRGQRARARGPTFREVRQGTNISAEVSY